MRATTTLKRSERAALSTFLDPRLTAVDLGDTWLAVDPSLGEAPVVPSMPPEDLGMPETIGSYRIVRRLGEGGRGIVYEALHMGLEARRAIKVLHAEASRDSLCVAEIQHEARVTAQLRDAGIEGIVWVPDVGQMEDGRWYMVVELLDGRTLQTEVFEDADKWAKRHGIRVEPDAEYPPEAYQLPMGRMVSIANQVAVTMEAAHRLGVIHRDLKPANIFLVRNGKGEVVRVVDFGLALRLRSTSPDWLPPGALVGSPPYMPPEQVRGEAADARSDIYALGVVLYEGLAGRWPHEGHEDMGKAKLTVVPPLVTEFRPEVPNGIAVLLQDALAINQNARPQSMAEFADRLCAAMKARVADVETRRQQSARSGGILGTLLGLVVVSALIAGGLMGWRQGDPASFAKFAGGAREVARVVREVSRPVVEWVSEELKGVELPEFLRLEEPTPKPAETAKVKEAPKKTKAPPVRRKAKRRRAKARATTAAPDASTGALPSATPP